MFRMSFGRQRASSARPISVRAEQLEARQLFAAAAMDVPDDLPIASIVVPWQRGPRRAASPAPAQPPPTQQPSVQQPLGTVTAEQVGTSGLTLSWPASPGASRYRIKYTPGAYLPGPAGGPQTLEVAAPATSASLGGLESFTLYSVDVTTLDPAGAETTKHLNTWTAAPATLERYLYAFSLPKNKQGFTDLEPQIEVFDINDGHRWVKNIPLPTGIYNVRGVAGHAATGRLYVSYFNTFNEGYQPGGLLCLDATSGAVIYQRDYPKSVIPSPDRFDITPDGKKIYMPVGEHGEDSFWVVIDAETGEAQERIYHTTAPHNTIVSLDGRLAFLEGQEKGDQPPEVDRTLGVVDTGTDKIIRRIGPFRDVIRPFTVNGKGSLAFVTVNNFVGFQVGDVATGRVLYTAGPTDYAQPNPPPGRVLSHGIALTPDEREVWVVDGLKAGFHVFDVSRVPAAAPRYVRFVQTRGLGRDLSGKVDPAASNDVTGAPAWVNSSYDGKYMYPESGEVIDVASKRVVGQLRAKMTNSAGRLVDAPYTHSRFILEVNFDGGKPVRVTNQFGVGRVR